MLRELAVHFSNAWRVLRFVSESTPDCSAPRCSAEAFAYESLTSPAEGIDIAIGFRPGSAERNEPFFDVAFAPRPKLGAGEIDDLAELEGGGEWNDEEWFGAVLPGSTYPIYDTESAKAASVLAFFDSALDNFASSPASRSIEDERDCPFRYANDAQEPSRSASLRRISVWRARESG